MFSEDYVNNLVMNIHLGIAITDKDGFIKVVNLKFSDMFGYETNELLGIHISDLFDGFNLVKESLDLNKAIIDEEVYVHSKRNKLRYILSAYLIAGKMDGVQDQLYIFDDYKKERRLAGKIEGNRAIYTFDKIISRNKDFVKLIDFAKKIADSKSTVLISGETGTGKEVFAQSIHNYSDRKNQPFIAINSAAIPRNLIESELFGYEEGAFTGAKKSGQAGKFELAHKGTIFLDEIGEMPLELQTRLLRVVEEGIVSRIGGREQIIVDVRIIAASNKNLREEVARGQFREDLFYRLNVLPLNILPLRQRKDDIPILIEYLMKRLSKKLNKNEVGITRDQMKGLMEYSWPGNVRELENLTELIINLGYVPEGLLDDEIPEESIKHTYSNKDLSMDTIERNHIIKVLNICEGNITKSARSLGIARNTLYRRIEKLNINCSD